MRRIISFRLAAQLSLWLIGLFMVLHLSVITGIVLFDFVPIEYLWGGSMETEEQLLFFEIISLAVMIASLIIVLIRAEKIKAPGLNRLARVGVWVLFVIFVINTLGNIFAETAFEKFFAIFTAVLALLCLRLGIE